MCGCALQACDAGACAGCSALSVCMLWCMWSFHARGEVARLSPSAENGRCRTPTLRVDTLPLQGGSTCTSTPPASLPLTFPRWRPAEDPGAPLLSAVCVSPSPWQPPGSGAAKGRKTQRSPAKMRTTCDKCLNYMLHVSTWRALLKIQRATKHGKKKSGEAETLKRNVPKFRDIRSPPPETRSLATRWARAATSRL